MGRTLTLYTAVWLLSNLSSASAQVVNPTARDAQARSRLSKLEYRVDPRNYGHVANDNADDRAAVQAAIDAAEDNGGGTVMLPPGETNLSGGLIFPEGVTVAIEGVDTTVVVKATNASTWDTYEAMFYIPGPTSGVGRRDGFVKTIRFDGNSLCPVALHAFGLVQWRFEDLSFKNFTRVAKRLDGIQNCNFYTQRSEKCGSGHVKGSVSNTPDVSAPYPEGALGAGAVDPPFSDCYILLDHGSANNHFYNEQITDSVTATDDGSVHHIIFAQSSQSDLNGNAVNHSNVFHGGQTERGVEETRALIYQSAGQGNRLNNVILANYNAQPTLEVTKQSTTGAGGTTVASNTLYAIDCSFSGKIATANTIIRADTTDAPAAIIRNPTIENMATWMACADTTYVAIQGTRSGGEPATFLTNITAWNSGTAGTKLSMAVVAQEINKFTGTPVTLPDGTNWGSISWNSTYQYFQTQDAGQVRNIPSNTQYASAVSFSSNIATPNAANGVFQYLTISTGTAFTINPPSNNTSSRFLALDIINSSGGALGTVTWDSAYKLASTWASPANGARVTVLFVSNGNVWIELGRYPAASGATTLDALTDVDTSGVTDGDVLTYDSGGWVAAEPPGAGAGAPTDATYWTASSNGTLSAEVVVNDSAGLRAALSDESGTGAALFASGALGTPTSGTLTNCTGLPVAGITASTSTALGVGSIELGHASDTTLARSSAGVVTIETVPIVTTTATQTLTNKAISGGTVNNAVIGGTTPEAGTFTVLNVNSSLNFYDNDNSAYGSIEHATSTYTFLDFDGVPAGISSGAISASNLSLTTDLSVANGGTGASSFTSGNWLKGAGTSAITSFTPGSNVETWVITPSLTNFGNALTGEGTGVIAAMGNAIDASGGLLTFSGLGSVTQAYDADLADLADGSLTGTKVGFADTDNLWTATNVQAALEELNDSINSGAANGTGAKVHWSQLLGVPAGFADGTDDGGGGGSDDQVASEVPFTPAGNLAADDVQEALEELDTEKQPLNQGLTDLAGVYGVGMADNSLLYWDASDEDYKAVDFGGGGDLAWQDDSIILGPIDHDLTPSSPDTLFLGADGSEWAAVFVTDDPYIETNWDDNETVPTKNALRDKIETLQPLDSDLTSWAAVARGSGIDTFVTTPSVTNFFGALTGEGTGYNTAMANNVNASGGLTSTANGANPSATAGETAVNGSATTWMRSDGAPAVTVATTSAKGISELAVASEINTGTDTGRTITPAEFSDSIYGQIPVTVTLGTDLVAMTTGDGKAYFLIPPKLNGMNLVSIAGALHTGSSSGTPTFQVRRYRASGPTTVDMLSTAITFDASSETLLSGSSTSAGDGSNGYQIDTTNDDVLTDDIIYIDCDTAGTGTKAPQFWLFFQIP